jgi:hypothetical protein
MQKPRTNREADELSLPVSPRWFWIAYLAVAAMVTLGILAIPGILAWWLI